MRHIRLKRLCPALLMISVLLTALCSYEMPRAGAANPQGQSQFESDTNVTCELQATSRLGNLTYRPDQWGEFLLLMQNNDTTPRELLFTSYFEGNPSLQYGRTVWLPPRCRLAIPHPARFPAADQISDGAVLVRSLLIDQAATGDREVQITTASGELQRQRTFRVSSSERHTGIIAGWEMNDQVPQEVIDVVVAARVYQGLDNRVTFLDGQFLPADEFSLEYLDHLVLAEDRLVNDVAALQAVRRWIHDGGRLWIMMDRTGPELVELLFGDEFKGSVVDQVGLTSIRVDAPPSVAAPNGVQGEIVERDEPVLMTRLAGSEMKVWNTVNEWPAALTRNFGKGRVLITTMGPRGWIRPASPLPEGIEDSRPQNKKSDYVPMSPMEDFAPYILARREPEPLPSDALEPFAQEFISYDVPQGTLVFGLMAGFISLLAIVGAALWRWSRLEHFGWFGSLLAIVFGGVFLGVGLSNRHATSEVMASVQLAQAIPGTDDVQTTGAVAVYRAEGSESQIGTSHGGELLPDLSGSQGSISRMVTTDLGEFHWDGLRQTPGISVYPVATSKSDTQRLEATATVDSEGIAGSCTVGLTGPTSALIATRRGRVGVTIGADGNFTAKATDVMQAGQYVKATLLDDTQDRRRRILQGLFSDRNWSSSLEQPQLLLWMSDWDHAFEFGEGLERRGDTLLLTPLALTRPPVDATVLIPSPLLDYSSCLPPDGSPAGGFWDDGNQEWQERTTRSTTWLNVHVPRVFLPLRLSQVRLEASVSGLMGQIEILGVRDGEAVSLQAVDNPVGTVVLEVDTSDALSVSDNGNLTLGIAAGVQQDADSLSNENAAGGLNINQNAPASGWQIESLSVQLRAVTTAAAVE